MSTQTAVMSFIDRLYEHINNHQKCLAIFVDLSKAFDLVTHEILLSKMKSLGLRGHVNDLIRSYLFNRKQLVEVRGVRSSLCSIDCGVPQGSTLGPLLFLLFVNDLPDVVGDPLNLVMFADDNTLLSSGRSMSDALSDARVDLNGISGWLDKNRLFLNVSKTVFMKFSLKNTIDHTNKSLLLKVNSRSIEQVNVARFLGIEIDSNLNWHQHIDSLCSKLSSVCYALFRLKTSTNEKICLSYYHSHFRSRLMYGIMFWGSSAYSDRVFKLQKRAVRSICGVSRRSSCRPLFKRLKLLPLVCMFILETTKYVKSNIKSFLHLNYNHKYATRQFLDLAIPRHGSSVYERSPRYMGIKLYNSLPIEFKRIDSVLLFGRAVEQFLLSECFYTFDEFFEFNC